MLNARSLLLILMLGWAVSWGSADDFKVVYNEDYHPLSFREQGVMSGALIELMDELGKRAGISVVHEGYPWERAQLRVKNGEADAFVTLVNPVRAEYAVASAVPLVKADIIALASRNNPLLPELKKIATIDDAARYRHVNYIGSGWIKARLPKATVTALPTSAAIFEFLRSNRADLFIESELTIEYNASQLNVAQQFVILPVVFDTVEFRLQIAKKSKFASMLPLLDGKLRDMISDGTVKRTLEKYGHLSVARD